MYEKNAPSEPPVDVFHLRQDVLEHLRKQPPVTFEDLYDKLKEYDAAYALQLMSDAEHYSRDIGEKQAFAAGVMHVLHAQIASYEVGELEAVFSGDVGGADQPPSDAPDGDQPAAKPSRVRLGFWRSRGA